MVCCPIWERRFFVRPALRADALFAEVSGVIVSESICTLARMPLLSLQHHACLELLEMPGVALGFGMLDDKTFTGTRLWFGLTPTTNGQYSRAHAASLVTEDSPQLAGIRFQVSGSAK